jgi:hypothetical protein
MLIFQLIQYHLLARVLLVGGAHNQHKQTVAVNNNHNQRKQTVAVNNNHNQRKQTVAVNNNRNQRKQTVVLSNNHKQIATDAHHKPLVCQMFHNFIFISSKKFRLFIFLAKNRSII